MARRPSGRFVLAACVVVALLLVLADVRGAALPNVLRGVAGALAGPPEQVLAWARSGVVDRLGASTRDAQEQIAELEAELASARSQAAAAATAQLDERALRQLAAGAPASGFRMVPGRVVAVASAQDQVRSATISVGSTHDVAVGQAVITGAGMLGVVDSVSPLVATVRLVVDPASTIAVRVGDSGEAGLHRGAGSDGSLELLDPLGPMAPGDLVVTLGTPTLGVPGGLLIGRIAAVTGSAADLTRTARVAPAVDDSTADRVAVLVPAPPAAVPAASGAPVAAPTSAGEAQ